MNGKRAKLLRKLVYTDGDDPKASRKYGRKANGQIVSDPNRQRYQRLKKFMKNPRRYAHYFKSGV